MKKFLVLLLSVALLTGMSNNVFAQSNYYLQSDTPSYQGLVDIGTHSLYVNMQGEGEPSIVFESGYGDTNDFWSVIQTNLKEDYATFSYDRAKLGKSEDNGLEKNVLQQVEELRALLHTKQVEAPYILIGHSAGAYIVKTFMALYPEEVAGVLLIDGTSEYQDEELLTLMPEFLQEDMKKSLTAEGDYKTIVKSGDIIKKLLADADFSNIPITVLTATKPLGLDEIVPGLDAKITAKQIELQGRILTKTNYGSQILVDSGHYIYQEQPQIVIDAIRTLAER
jgi:pimeloyl-ACP methyl ester carboxylesterase